MHFSKVVRAYKYLVYVYACAFRRAKGLEKIHDSHGVVSFFLMQSSALYLPRCFDETSKSPTVSS